MALLTGGALLAGWLMARGAPLLKDEVCFGDSFHSFALLLHVQRRMD